MFTAYAKKTALYGTTLLAVAALSIGLFTSRGEEVYMRLVLFYVILVLNTYYSIRCFESIDESSGAPQRVVNVMLVVLYLVLSTQFANPTLFLAVTSLMFLVACLKYAMMLDSDHHRTLIQHKIMLDVVGGIITAAALIGFLVGDDTYSLDIWLLAFFLANIHLLFVEPFYVPAEDPRPTIL